MVILTLVFSFLLRVSIPNFAPWVLIGLLYLTNGEVKAFGSSEEVTNQYTRDVLVSPET
jgi:ABC-type polysaccharide/polyol phosphate export permease